MSNEITCRCKFANANSVESFLQIVTWQDVAAAAAEGVAGWLAAKIISELFIGQATDSLAAYNKCLLRALDCAFLQNTLNTVGICYTNASQYLGYFNNTSENGNHELRKTHLDNAYREATTLVNTLASALKYTDGDTMTKVFGQYITAISLQLSVWQAMYKFYGSSSENGILQTMKEIILLAKTNCKNVQSRRLAGLRDIHPEVTYSCGGSECGDDAGYYSRVAYGGKIYVVGPRQSWQDAYDDMLKELESQVIYHYNLWNANFYTVAERCFDEWENGCNPTT